MVFKQKTTACKILAAVFFLVLLFSPAGASAQVQEINQEISLVPDNTVSIIGTSVSVTAQYNCSDADVTALGIKIRDHSKSALYNITI